SCFVLMLFMAWSPTRRFNVGRFEVEHPGDYATFNSNQLRDGTIPIFNPLPRPLCDMPSIGLSRDSDSFQHVALGFTRFGICDQDQRHLQARMTILWQLPVVDPHQSR